MIANEETLVVVPCLAVDRNYYRIGYGGGFYDKYLSEHRTMANVCVAFSEQVAENVPYESLDVKVDYVITDVESF